MDRPKPEQLSGLPGAWYVRISLDDSKQDVTSQRMEIERWLERHQLTVNRENRFEDAEGYTPRHRPDDRPEFQRLMQAVRSGLVKWLVVAHQYRIGGKDEWHYASLIQRFREAGCSVWTVNDELLSGDGGLAFFQGGITAGTSRQEQLAKARHVLRGQRAKALRGEWMGGYVPYGLDVVCRDRQGQERWRVRWHGHFVRSLIQANGVIEEFNGKGNFPAHHPGETLWLIPSGDAERVDAVRSIFRWYATESLSTYQIARRLNDLGIKPTYSDLWLGCHVVTVLKNTAYIGLPAWNKQGGGEFLEDDGVQVREVTKATGRRERPRTAWMQPKEPIFEPLIDKDTWDAVQAKINKPRKNRAPKTPEMYMAGIVFCAGCGHAMRGQRRPNFCQYSCYIYDRDRNNPSGCQRNAINQNLIEVALEWYFRDAGETLDVLERVQETGDLCLLGSLDSRMRQMWKSGLELMDRMTDFCSRHPTEERKKAPCGGRLLDLKPDSSFTDYLIELYEASFNQNAGSIRQRLKELESEHQRLVRECRNLPERSRALKQAQEEILAVEARMDQSEADLTSVAATMREAGVELARVRANMDGAKNAIKADIGLRMRAEKLRGVIHRINVRFEPTGRKYPKSRAVEIEIVPKTGEPVKYRTDDLRCTAPAPPALRSCGRSLPPGE